MLSSAVSSNLAPAAALSPCFHLWMQQALGGCMAQHLASALQHIKGVFSLSAFLKSLFSSFLHVTSWKEITFWSLLAILFLELLLSVPQLPALSHIPHYRSRMRDGPTLAGLPESLSAPTTFFHPLEAAELWATLTSVNPFKKAVIAPNTIYYFYEWKKKGSKHSQTNRGACNSQYITSATSVCAHKLKYNDNKPGLLTIQQTLQSSPLDQHSSVCLLSAVGLSALHQWSSPTHHLSTLHLFQVPGISKKSLFFPVTKNKRLLKADPYWKQMLKQKQHIKAQQASISSIISFPCLKQHSAQWHHCKNMRRIS